MHFSMVAAGALGHVLDGEGVLDRRDALHREVRDALRLVVAAAEDAGLVEMDVRLDEARADQPAAAPAPAPWRVPPSPGPMAAMRPSFTPMSVAG